MAAGQRLIADSGTNEIVGANVDMAWQIRRVIAAWYSTLHLYLAFVTGNILDVAALESVDMMAARKLKVGWHCDGHTTRLLTGLMAELVTRMSTSEYLRTGFEALHCAM